MWPWRKTTAQTTFLDLRHEMDALETRQLRLEEQFRSLRGYVYAKKGLVGPPGEAPAGDIDAARSAVAPKGTASPESRDELRRRMVREGRFIPGQPPKHEGS